MYVRRVRVPQREGVAVNSGVYKNNVLVLLEGNAPSNLGHELTTEENTQLHEEWSRQHADDIAVYQGPTTDDALNSDIFHFSGLIPLQLPPPSLPPHIVLHRQTYQTQW